MNRRRDSSDLLAAFIFSFCLLALVIMVAFWSDSRTDSRSKASSDDTVVSTAIAAIQGQQASWVDNGEYALGTAQLEIVSPEAVSALSDKKIDYELISATNNLIIFEVSASDDSISGASLRIALRKGQVVSVFCSEVGNRCQDELLLSPELGER